MKIQANRDELLGPLLKVNNVVERRQTLPILGNILVDAIGEDLYLTATDLEVQLTTKAPAVIEREMGFTLPARKFVDICKALPEGAVLQLEILGDKIVLRSGRARFTVSTLPAADYPKMEPAADSQKLALPQHVLKRLIERTAFAMAYQDVRYFLNGMLLEVTVGRMRTVATDGHRLATCDASTDSGEKEVQIILPRKGALELGRSLVDDDGTVELEIGQNQLRVSGPDMVFTTKLIDGRFPDYERVIPSVVGSHLIANRQELRQSLTRTSILSNENYRGVRFRLTEGRLQLQAHNPEHEEAEEELEVEYSGPALSVGFNVGYLLDVLNVLEGEQVDIGLTDADSSALITEVGSTERRYVIMPMRL